MSEGKYPVEVRQEHTYCPLTYYCMRCGVSKHMVHDLNILCAASENLVAISHRRRLQVLATRTGLPGLA